MVADRIATHGSETVLRKKHRGIWQAVTWSQLGEHMREVGGGLKAIGFRPGDTACVLADTCPDWVYADLGIQGAGGVSGGIDPAEDAQSVGQMLHQADCRVLFVDNEEQLDKVLLVRERCPTLQRIVIFDTKGLRDFTDPMCESFQAFVARGAEYDRTHTGDWSAGIAAIGADQPAALLFSCGHVTGKCRMLTHGDALHLVASARSMVQPRVGDERLALLPMCQMMERVLGLYLALDARAVSNYLENPDTGIENLQELQPTMLGTDPRVWQSLHERTAHAAAGATRLQRLLYRGAIAAGQRGGVLAALARLCVLRAVRRELGLSRLRRAYIGAASLPSDVERWVLALGIEIQQIDGHANRGIAVDARYRALIDEAYGT
jgi:long-chain acyl-CoA synthetase